MNDDLLHHICILQVFDMNYDLCFWGTNGCISVIVFFHALENGSYHVFLFLYQIVKLKIEINIGYQNSKKIKNIIKFQ